MDEAHLLAAARYIAFNPVVAGLVSRAEDWPWSSTRAQLAGEDDELATVKPLRPLIPDFAALLAMPTDAATTTRIERAPTIGRRSGARNGSRCWSAGSAALWHPANPAQNREWSGTPHSKRSCCEEFPYILILHSATSPIFRTDRSFCLLLKSGLIVSRTTRRPRRLAAGERENARGGGKVCSRCIIRFVA
jgi:hypothetical protein